MSAIPFPARTAEFAYVRPTPIGDAQVRIVVGEDALVYASDDPFEPKGVEVRWDRVVDACTASLNGMGGPGGPEFPSWAQGSLEWLLVSTDDAPGHMWRLAPGPGRDAIVAALRERLGTRWLGEGLPLKDAQRRLGAAETNWNIPKLIVLVASVLALLALAIIALGFMLTPFVLAPACIALGIATCRFALARLRTADAAERIAPVPTHLVRPGVVRLEGRAATDHPTTSAVTGRPCVWWDVTVSLEYREDNVDTWRQVAYRHDGTIDIVDLEDERGRIPVWLDGAALVLDHDTWVSKTDALPPDGVALLARLGFPWNGSQSIRVVEERLEIGATLTVVGTADARRDLPARSEPTLVERVQRSIVTGAWKRDLIRAVPSLLKAPLAIAIGYLGMMITLSTGRMRAPRVEATERPAVAPGTLVVWQGRRDAPFLVSNRPIGDALALARQRALLYGAIGVAALVFAGYQLVTVLR